MGLKERLCRLSSVKTAVAQNLSNTTPSLYPTFYFFSFFRLTHQYSKPVSMPMEIGLHAHEILDGWAWILFSIFKDLLYKTYFSDQKKRLTRYFLGGELH